VKYDPDDCLIILAKDVRNKILLWIFDNLLIWRGTRPSAEDCHQLIFRLVNDKTEIFKVKDIVPNMWNDYCDRLELLVEKLSKNAPNLREISFPSGEFVVCDVTTPFSTVSAPFSNLQLFDCFPWKWANKDVNLLTKNAPNLVTLRVSKM
jgi:hypothetical protein